ncbi:MAG: tetratricopeptide repeat protein [Saprospiraceae bacterium]|nr:tetratricopeptide repeat protein [Saprospiraceae bacterium]
MRIVFIGLIALFQSLHLFAQTTDDRYTEEQVSIEEQFIEAEKYKLLGDLDAAKTLFEQLLKKYRNHDVAAYELAEILHREGNYQDALHYINLALGIDPSNRWYLDLKTKIYSDDKKFDLAAEVYETITKLDPDNVYDLERKAWFYAKANQLQKAIDILDELESKVGVTEKTAYAKHDLYKQLGKKSKAVEVLEDLVGHFPKTVEYRHVLASYLKQIGKESQAEDVYRQILIIDPQDARANVALASTFKKDGNDGGYLSSIKPIIENPEASIDVKIAELMPYVKQLQKNRDPAVMSTMMELMQLLEKAHPGEAKAYALHADLLSIAGDDTEAAKYYKKTLELDESNYLVWEQLLLLQMELGQMQDLIKTSEEAIEIFPNQSMLYYLNGLGQMNLGNYNDATDQLDQALMMVGRRNDLKLNILAMLGKAYHEIHDYEASTEAYDNALLIAPADPRILNDYSYCLAERGERLSEADKMMDKALSKDGQNPKLLATKAWIAYRNQNLDAARDWMEKSMKQGGEQIGYILEKYGDILYKSDQKEKALKYWKAAQDKGTGSKWLDRKIEEEKLIEQQ